jgi:hypothetical protein
MAKFVCPYCMNSYEKKEVLYICPTCGEVAIPRFFESGSIKCKKSGCGGLATKRVCPSCNEEIPKPALETPNLLFSIVGVSNSGKTNYITVMLNELGRASGLRLSLSPQNKETRDHQNKNYKYIYEDHKRPESTAAGVDNVHPQIWEIRNLLKKFGNDVSAYTFTIFDGAGEDHEKNMDLSSSVCRYIQVSKAIIIALDPLILSSIRRGGIVDEKVMSNSMTGNKGEYKNAMDIVNDLAKYIKTARGMNTKKMLDIPVAVVLTKFDTIISHKDFAPSAVIKKPVLDTSGNRVNMGEIQQVDGEIRHWLNEIGEGAFIDALESNFREFYFFGVSSYGEPPKDKFILNEKIHPHRVLDPIYWLFKKFNFID